MAQTKKVLDTETTHGDLVAQLLAQHEQVRKAIDEVANTKTPDSRQNAFVRLRELMFSNERLVQRIDELEGKFDKQFKLVFRAIRKLVVPFSKRRQIIGFEAMPKGKPGSD